MEEQGRIFDLVECGRRACEQLWLMAQDAETPRAERVKLLQWFAAMGIGTPRPMPEALGEDAGGGVIVLPAVPEYDDDGDLTV